MPSARLQTSHKGVAFFVLRALSSLHDSGRTMVPVDGGALRFAAEFTQIRIDKISTEQSALRPLPIPSRRTEAGLAFVVPKSVHASEVLGPSQCFAEATRYRGSTSRVKHGLRVIN